MLEYGVRNYIISVLNFGKPFVDVVRNTYFKWFSACMRPLPKQFRDQKSKMNNEMLVSRYPPLVKWSRKVNDRRVHHKKNK